MSSTARGSAGRSRAIAGVEFEGMILGRHLVPPAVGDETGLQLERSAYTLLSRIELDGPSSIKGLSDAFGLDASTLNRQTAKMVRQGLMRRIPDPDGGLARKFEITAEGARKLASDRALKLAGLTEILGGWPDADVDLLAALLRRFNLSIEERDRHHWPRPEGEPGM